MNRSVLERHKYNKVVDFKNGKCASVDEYGGGGGASAYSTRGARSITGDSEQTILDDSYAFGNIYQKDAYLVFRALCILSQKGEGDGTDPKLVTYCT